MKCSVPRRSQFEGMLRVVWFNWPLYAAAVGVVISLILLAALPACAGLPQLFLHLLAALVLLQTALSLLASHWVYDRSALRDWQFLSQLVSVQPEGDDRLRIVNVHSGYDETSGVLRRVFPDANIDVIDLFSTLDQKEPSIVKARKLYPPTVDCLCETVDGWPLSDASIDLILIAFAAHEVRNHEKRELLFSQASKVLKPHGRILLVEHVRDFANFVAFGPGFMHFLPLSEWIRCAKQANLKVAKQYRITPLVAVLELCL